jgi:hypothetical protein
MTSVLTEVHLDLVDDPMHTCQVTNHELGAAQLVPGAHVAFEGDPAALHCRADLGVRDNHVPLDDEPAPSA